MSLPGSLLKRRDFVDPALVPSSLEICRKPYFDYFLCRRRVHEASSQAQHVCVVMKPAQTSCLRAWCHGRPDAGNLVGGNAHADPSAAKENALFRFPADDFDSNLPSEIRVVHAFGRICAAVEDLDTHVRQVRLDFLFQFISCMIAAEGYSHAEQHNI